MNRKDWIVAEKDVLHPGRTRCRFCSVKLGGQHNANCVCRKRTVVVRVAIDLVVDEPEEWSKEDIEFYYNDSSSCCNNVINKINELHQKFEKNNIEESGFELGCFCPIMNVEYVREATTEDEASQMNFIEDK